MKILLALDSFKESINAIDLCEFLESKIIAKAPGSQVIKLPVSDGGEQFLKIMMNNLPMKSIEVQVSGPLGHPVQAIYGLCNDTAYIEMAQTAGLQLLEEKEKDPLKTTTFGCGQMIKDAIKRGITNYVIGIGGSATCDGGAGMAQALGFEFIDKQGKRIDEKMNGKIIGKVAEIRAPILPVLKIKVACDVNNPLLGNNGAVYTYAEQKGATKQDLPFLEKNMENLNHLFKTNLCRKIAERPGAGAAGGLGAGLIAFLDGQLVSGSRLVLDRLRFDELVKDADLAITGEGKYDAQSGQGKIVSEIVSRCQQQDKPVIGIFGKYEPYDQSHFQYIFQLTDYASPVKTIRNPKKYFFKTIDKMFSSIAILKDN